MTDPHARREQALAHAFDTAARIDEALADLPERRERNRIEALLARRRAEPAPEPISGKSQQPPAFPARKRSGTLDVQKLLAGIADAVGQSLAKERQRNDDAIREVRAENARLLTRVLELEGRGRETAGLLPSLALVKGGRRDAA